MGSALANLAYGMFPLTPDQKRICKKNVTFAQSHYSSTAIRFLLEAAGCSFQRREVNDAQSLPLLPLYRLYGDQVLDDLLANEITREKAAEPIRSISNTESSQI